MALNFRTKGDPTVAKAKTKTKTKTKTNAKRRKKAVANAAGAKGKKRRASPNEEKASSADDLAEARQRVEAARAKLDSAEEAARQLAQEARDLLAQAKGPYRESVAHYRALSLKAGVECEFAATRRSSLTERVSFRLERTQEGVRVIIKDRPESEELIPLAALEESVSRAAYAYTDRHLGRREEIGNKGGGLSNRLRALLV